MSFHIMTPVVTTVSNISTLKDRLEEWTSFTVRWGISPPFAGPATWVSWLETQPDCEPAIFELREGTRLLALLPMYRKGRTYRMAADQYLDYQDMVAVSDSAALDLLEAVLETGGNEGFTFTFAKISENSRLSNALNHPRVHEVAAIRHRYWGSCPVANFCLKQPGEFLGALSSRQRRDHKLALSRLRDLYPDSHVEVYGESPIPEEVIAAVARLHRENQYRKSGESIFSDPAFLQFLRRQSEYDAEIRLSVLWTHQGGAPIAFSLGYQHDHTFYYYLTSYEGSLADYSPGRIVMFETLVRFAKVMGGENLRLDFLSGLEPYKSRWAKSYYNLWRYQALPKRAAYLPKRIAYTALYGLKSAKEKIRNRLGYNGASGLEHEEDGLSS